MFDILYKNNSEYIYPPHDTAINDVIIIYWNTQEERLKELKKLTKSEWFVKELQDIDDEKPLYAVCIDDDMAGAFALDSDAYEYCCKIIARDTFNNVTDEYKIFPLELKYESAMGAVVLNSDLEILNRIKEYSNEHESQIIRMLCRAIETDMAEMVLNEGEV